MWCGCWCQAEMLTYWDFPTQSFLKFTENGPKSRKYPASRISVEANATLMSDVQSDWIDWFDLTGRQQ